MAKVFYFYNRLIGVCLHRLIRVFAKVCPLSPNEYFSQLIFKLTPFSLKTVSSHQYTCLKKRVGLLWCAPETLFSRSVGESVELVFFEPEDAVRGRDMSSLLLVPHSRRAVCDIGTHSAGAPLAFQLKNSSITSLIKLLVRRNLNFSYARSK